MDYRARAREIALEERVNPDLFLKLVGAESGFNPGARSPKGAIGLGQLMPATAAELGVDPTDPEQNLRGSARYLRQMHDKFQSTPLAVAAYNAGPGRVQRAGGIPAIPETEAYVKKVAGDPSLQSGADIFGMGAPAAPKAAPALPSQPTIRQGADGVIEIDINEGRGGQLASGADIFETAPAAAVTSAADSVSPPAAKLYNKGIWGETVAAFNEGADMVGRGLKAGADKEARNQKLPIAQRLARFLPDIAEDRGRELGIAGGVVSAALSPVTGVTRALVTKPAAEGLSRVLPPGYERRPLADQLKAILSGRVDAPRRLSREETRDMIEGDVANALAAGMPGRGAPALPAVAPKMTQRVAAALERAALADETSLGAVAAAAKAAPGVPAFQAGGENLTGLAEVIAQSPGKGATRITKAVRDSQAMAADRIKRNIAEGLGGRGDYFATVDTKIQSRALEAEPYKTSAFSQPVDADVYVQRFEPILKRLPKGALEAAYDIARREGRAPEELGLLTAQDTFSGFSAGKAPLADITADDLAALKGGGKKSPQGKSLIEFISKNGGLSDVGGELAARDLDLWHRQRPFLPKAIREGGLGEEAMAQRAWEAGYFPDKPPPTMDSADNMAAVSAQDLRDAISRELSGKKSFASAGRAEPDGRLDQLERDLLEAGVNPRTASLKEAREALGRLNDDRARLAAFADETGPGMSANEPVQVVNPTMETLHYIKKGLDQSLEQYRNALGRLDLTGSPAARADASTRKALARTMRETNKDYDEFMRVWGEESGHKDALELGRDILSGKTELSSELLAGRVKEMNPVEREYFQKGVGEAILDRVRRQGGVPALRQLLKSEEFGDRVKLAFQSKGEFDKFMQAAETEVIREARNNRVLNNSRTFGRQAASEDLKAQAGMDPLDIVSGAVDAAADIPSLPGKALKAALKTLPRKDRSIFGDPEMSDLLGKALVDPDEMTKLLNVLEAVKARRAAPLSLRLSAATRKASPLLLTDQAVGGERN